MWVSINVYCVKTAKVPWMCGLAQRMRAIWNFSKKFGTKYWFFVFWNYFRPFFFNFLCSNVFFVFSVVFFSRCVVGKCTRLQQPSPAHWWVAALQFPQSPRWRWCEGLPNPPASTLNPRPNHQIMILRVYYKRISFAAPRWL